MYVAALGNADGKGSGGVFDGSQDI
nr:MULTISPECIES: selenium-binding family protein [unclassified Rhizobium]